MKREDVEEGGCGGRRVWREELWSEGEEEVDREWKRRRERGADRDMRLCIIRSLQALVHSYPVAGDTHQAGQTASLILPHHLVLLV